MSSSSAPLPEGSVDPSNELVDVDGAFLRGVVGHSGPKNYLSEAVRTGRLPHALLFAGPSGVGKSKCAHELARWILTRVDSGTHSARKFESRNHPDFHPISREEGRTQIRMDQLRQLQAELTSQPLEADRHVVLIDEAHCLPNDAQDVLLKTLEEPSTETLFLLVTHQLSWIRPTIRSRCHMVRFGVLGDSELLAVAADIDLDLPEALPVGVAEGRPGLLEALIEEQALWPRELWLGLLRSPEKARAVHDAADLYRWATRELESPEGKSRPIVRERVLRALSFLASLSRDALILRVDPEGDTLTQESLCHRDRIEGLRTAHVIRTVDDLDDILERISRARRALSLNISAKLVIEELILWFRGRFSS